MKPWLIALVGLAGCTAAHTWQPGPSVAGATADDFARAQAQCSIAARHSGGGGFVLGPPAFIVGAAIGHAISESNRTQADFNDCMTIQGWRPAQ